MELLGRVSSPLDLEVYGHRWSRGGQLRVVDASTVQVPLSKMRCHFQHLQQKKRKAQMLLLIVTTDSSV